MSSHFIEADIPDPRAAYFNSLKEKYLSEDVRRILFQGREGVVLTSEMIAILAAAIASRISTNPDLGDFAASYLEGVLEVTVGWPWRDGEALRLLVEELGPAGMQLWRADFSSEAARVANRA